MSDRHLELEVKSLKEKIIELELIIKNQNEKYESYVEAQTKSRKKYAEAQHLAQIKYVEANPEITRQRKLAYMVKLKETNPEKIKQYSHTAYLNKKERLKAQKEAEDKKNGEAISE